MFAAPLMTFRKCAALAAVMLLTACSNGDEEQPATARSDNVPNVPGTATMYVFNTRTPTFAIGKNTLFDYQQPLVTVSDSRYAIVLVYGGRHVLSCAGMTAVPPIVFDAVPGATYYFQTFSGGDGTQQICGFLPPDRGQKLLALMQSR